MQTRSTTRRLLAPASGLAAMLVALTALSAWAHPGWDPNEVPAGGPVEVELVIPHGCGVDGGEPEGDEASPITEVALQITDEFGLRPQPVEGFDVLVEDDVAGWFAVDGGSQTELVLPAVIAVSGDPGDVLPVPVYQECANGESYRWAAGEGEDGDPAVNLTIVDGDPEPLPPESEVPTPGQDLPLAPSPSATADQGATEAQNQDQNQDQTEATTEPSPASTESTEPTATETTSVTPSASPTPSVTPSITATPQAADVDDDGINLALWLPVAVAIAIAVFAATRFGDGDDDGAPAAGDATGEAPPPSDGS